MDAPQIGGIFMMANNWAGWEAFKKQVQKYLGKQNNTSINIEVNGIVMAFNGFIVGGRTYVRLRETGEKTEYFEVIYDKIVKIWRILN